MNSNITLKVIIASSSAIIRGGLATVLKRIPDLKINAIEVNSIEALQNYVRLQTPNVIVIDPMMGGWFDLQEFKQQYDKRSAIKYVALLCSIVDTSLLKDYNQTLTLYDSYDTMAEKLNELFSDGAEEHVDEQELLSQREKEIITYVVKGMTNKEIASNLNLSIHTVITHRRNIARKLQIHTTSGLTIYAIVNKLVELKDIEGKAE